MWRYFLLSFAAMLMAGCASLPVLTTYDVEQNLSSLSKLNSSQKSGSNDESIYAWFQPANLTQDCKIWLPENEKEQIATLYWDGECSDGFATGLGRAFVSGKGWAEALLIEVSAPNTPGYVYYFVDFWDHLYLFVNTDINSLAHSSGQMIKVDVAGGVNNFKALFADVVILNDKETIVKYRNLESSATFYRSERGELARTVVINNNLDSDVHKIYYIEHQEELVGYYQHHYWNGDVRSFVAGTQQEIVLPASFAAEFEQMIQTFERHKPRVARNVAAAQEKIVAYRKRICIEDDSPIANISDSKYLNICKPGGELSNYESLIKHKANQLAEIDAKARQEYIKLVRHRSANEFSWSKAFLAFAKGLEQGGNAMRQSSSYTPTNSYQAPQVQMPDYFQQNKQPLYEYLANPLNSLETSQVLVDTKKSGSGRTVCVYSSGSTKVLPYGNVTCPRTYP